jgi:hypothetical protein
MHRISSNTTLFFKIFLPTFWMVFFGIFTLAVLMTDGIYIGGLSPIALKIGTLLFFVAGSGALYFSVLQLKRVELDDLYLYASNYFSVYRYPFHNIEKVEFRNIGIATLANVFLKIPGKYGRSISFLLDRDMWLKLLEQHPEIAAKLPGVQAES